MKAFGLNHADTYMRSGVWSFGVDVLGIEAAGTVVEDPSGALRPGTAVVAIVGGMARTRNGSYAELVTVPASNVAAVDTDPRLGRAGRDPGGLRDRLGRVAPQPGGRERVRPW